jgi:hypothetical protein
MNNLSSLLSYILLFSFLLNASPFQSGFEFFVSPDAATFAFQKHLDFNATHFGFITSVEESEDSEDHHTDSSNSNCCFLSGQLNIGLSGNYFTDFSTTAITFAPKEARYICYSSLKIPFPAIVS